MKSQFITLTTLIAAITLTVITLTLPLLHWASIPTQPLYQWLAGAAILSLGVCKLTFYPMGFRLWHHGQRLPAFCLLSFATVALCLSVAASRDWLTEQQAQHRIHQRATSQQAQQQSAALASINREIAQLLTLIEADTQAGYRQRAIKQQDKLQTLKTERTQLVAQSITATDHPINNQLGSGLTLFRWRFSAPLVSALALHIGCVLSVLAVTVWQPRLNGGLNGGLDKGLNAGLEGGLKKRLNPLNASNDVGLSEGLEPTLNGLNPNAAKGLNGGLEASLNEGLEQGLSGLNAAGLPFNDAPLNDDQKILAEKIVNGEFGQQFSLKRDLIEAKPIRGGYPKVKPVIDFLLTAQRIERRDNQFFICE